MSNYNYALFSPRNAFGSDCDFHIAQTMTLNVIKTNCKHFIKRHISHIRRTKIRRANLKKWHTKSLSQNDAFSYSFISFYQIPWAGILSEILLVQSHVTYFGKRTNLEIHPFIALTFWLVLIFAFFSRRPTKNEKPLT